jgi:RNA polymerase sigma-70 factor (ECF subfamily)
MPASKPASMAAPPHASDDELMTRIVAGDRDAFAALYRARRADVFRFAVHVSGSRSIADDVTQDVFMTVIQEARRYRAGRSGVLPWLLGIARNHVRRAHSRRPSEPLPDEASSDGRALAMDSDAVGGLVRQEYIDALRRAVLELPIKYREAIVLCDLQELSYADAAAALACAVGTVRSRLSRGRALLERRLLGSSDPVFRSSPARWIL